MPQNKLVLWAVAWNWPSKPPIIHPLRRKAKLMRRFVSRQFFILVMFAAAVFLFPTAGFATNGELKQFQMPNGLNVFVKEDHASKVAAIQLWVMVGSAYETDSERGISHVIEHMAFKGTERRSVGRIAQEVEEIGGEINAYTSWDETVFHIVVPSSAVSQGLDIVTDAVFRASIDTNELKKEKQVVIEEIFEEKDRPEDVVSEMLFKTAYTQSPYRFPVIGSKDIVEKITRNNILDFRKKWYVPENMFLVVAGDVDSDAVNKLVQRFTSDIKPTGFFKVLPAQEPPQDKIRTSLVRDRNAAETRLEVGFHIPSMKGNDVNALDLVADILGAREDSRLQRVVKQEKGLVNSISVDSLTPKQSGLMSISATLDAKNLQTAVKTIMEQLANLGRTPPSKEELEQAKIHIESQHVYSGETVQGTARSMGNYQNTLGDADYGGKYLALNSAVIPEQVSAAARKYLGPPNVTITVLLPDKEAMDFKIEELEKIVSGFAPAAKTVSTGETATQQTVFKELSNGIKVVLVPDNSNPVVSFRFAFLGGKRFEDKDTQGIMNFISRMFDKGAAGMSDVEIARKVDNMGGSLNGFSGNDSFGFYASFFSRHAQDGLELLSKLYTDPTFPQDKVDRERELIIAAIKSEPDTPTQYVVNILNKTFFLDFPYSFDKLGTPATVAAFTTDDLKRTYQRFAVPSNTVITAVGEMDTQKLLEKVEALFGSIPPKALEMPQIPAEQPLEKVRQELVRIPRAKAHLALGFKGTTLADSDRCPLDVLNEVLAGQGGRLFVQLRDREALAYVVTSFVRPGLNAGLFGFYLACETPKVDRAYEGMIKQIELIKEKKIGDAELKKGINNLIGNHLISLQSSSDRAESMGLYALYGLGYDYDSKYLQKVRGVTADDVLRVARKYLDLEHCAIVKVLPEGEEKGK